MCGSIRETALNVRIAVHREFGRDSGFRVHILMPTIEKWQQFTISLPTDRRSIRQQFIEPVICFCLRVYPPKYPRYRDDRRRITQYFWTCLKHSINEVGGLPSIVSKENHHAYECF